jgi:hypothetical protein
MGERNNSAGGHCEHDPGTCRWAELGRLCAANELCNDSDSDTTAAASAAKSICGASEREFGCVDADSLYKPVRQ